ncbi:helix-turn-helix domain-containing protein [Pseudonocardia xishanensis]|uniref:helix-turn-helix domain-containing protein n=1 Tax=Pseudonocardia xishanensis TaxID=630995 RepID=UPI0031ED2F83
MPRATAQVSRHLKVCAARVASADREAAELLRVDTSTLYRAIRAEEFPAVRIRARYLVPTQVIDQLIEDAIGTDRDSEPRRHDCRTPPTSLKPQSSELISALAGR